MTTLDQTISSQIGGFGLMVVGAENLSPALDGEGLSFSINIQPVHPNGSRGPAPRRMIANVLHDINDTYRVEVLYYEDDAKVTHLTLSGIYSGDLEAVMFGLENGTLHGTPGPGWI